MKRTLTPSDLTKEEIQVQGILLEAADHIGTVGNRPELRFAGGWVRDKLLCSDSDDIDVCIDNMTGWDFAEKMREYVAAKYPEKNDILHGQGKIPANPDKSKHLETATMRVFKLQLDFVNLRKEVYDPSSRTPTMKFGTAEEDALRRDSTVNSLFYNITSSTVEDLTGKGLDDLANKVIRTPLDPIETFRDDPLRVLRHVRFASRLGFEIAHEDEQAMSDVSIQEALRLKISRERIGTELEKMLKGPDPFRALLMIEKLGLYNTIFTNPNDSNFGRAAIPHMRSGHHMSSLAPEKYISDFSDILFSELNDEDRYRAWLLFALVPWAKVPLQNPKYSKGKVTTAAAVVVEQGIKAPSKIITLVQDAACFVGEIQDLIDDVHNRHDQDDAILRERYGKAIRRWRKDWRLHVLYAFFVHIYESDSASWHTIFERYKAWSSRVIMLELQDVVELQPLIKGDKLAVALGIKPGPWTGKAVDMVIEWQLRNWNSDDKAMAIAEVHARKAELGLKK